MCFLSRTIPTKTPTDIENVFKCNETFNLQKKKKPFNLNPDFIIAMLSG